MNLDKSKYSKVLEGKPEDIYIEQRGGMHGGLYIYECTSCGKWRTFKKEDFCPICIKNWKEYLFLSDVALARIDELVAKRQPLDVEPLPLDDD